MIGKNRLLLFLTLLLLVIGIVQGVWIHRQNQQIELLQVTEYGLLQGSINESINEIALFIETHDRSVLRSLQVRMLYLDREAQRAVELTNAEPIQKYSTSPGVLIALILQHNISNEQAEDYLLNVRQKLLTYQESVGSAEEIEENRRAFIKTWRDMFQYAHVTQQEWKLP